MAEYAFDAKGLVCPLPVLRLRKILKGVAIADIVAMEATDPAALSDVPAFCAEAGHALLSSETVDGVHRFRVRKGR